MAWRRSDAERYIRLSWKEQTGTLQLAAIGFGTFSLSGSDEPEQ